MAPLGGPAHLGGDRVIKEAEAHAGIVGIDAVVILQGSDGHIQGAAVAAMAVHVEDALDAVLMQGDRDVLEHLDIGLGPQGDRTGEGHMMGGDAVGDGRADQQLLTVVLAQQLAEGIGPGGIRIVGRIGTVLLTGAHRNDCDLHLR